MAAQDYAAAATLAARAQTLQSQDALAVAHSAIDAAVARHDFACAAALRDSAMLRLRGWWSVAPDSTDPQGHLLHVSESYGRLRARAYSPRQLAEAHGWHEGAQMQRSEARLPLEATGVPLFDVMLRQTSNGAATHNAIVKRLSQLQLTQMRLAFAAVLQANLHGFATKSAVYMQGVYRVTHSRYQMVRNVTRT